MKRVFLVQYYDGDEFKFKLVEVKCESYIECLIAMRNYQASRNDSNGEKGDGVFEIQSIMELSPTFDEDVMGAYFIHHGRVIDLHLADVEREVLQ